MAGRPVVDERAYAARFIQAVLSSGLCVFRGLDDRPCDGPMDAHHLCPKQRIRNAHKWTLDPEALAAAVYDPRIGVPLCRYHHGLVTVAALKVPASVVPGEAWDWAAQYGLKWGLDRELDWDR